jgi:uncharacterized membrane protein
MTNFPLGLITLVVVSILIYFGVAHRVLDKLRLSDRAALAIILAIIAGSFVDIPISSRITINLGGLVAVGLAIYVLAGAGTLYEKIRAIKTVLLWLPVLLCRGHLSNFPVMRPGAVPTVPTCKEVLAMNI